MPIKFRCNFCRQFLGISRAQAGGVVDCPSCGRSIRVPLLDGTIQPIADPELNLEDAHLARALDELAGLVNVPAPTYVSLKSVANDPNDGEMENLIPQPILEPIPIEVPIPPTPMIIQPPTNASLQAISTNGIANDGGLLAELVALSAGASPIESVEKSEVPVRAVKGETRLDRSPVLVATIILVTFVSGMLTERFVRILEGLRRGELPANRTTEHTVDEGVLTGRITYKTNEGESQPDRGARILAFPQSRSGEVKLSVIGFRPADSHADQLVANAALKAMGGSAATVDENGNFRLPIEAGSYRVLVLSHFQPRSDSATDPTLEKLLKDYFNDPDELLGRVQHQFSPLRIKGTGEVWDHSF